MHGTPASILTSICLAIVHTYHSNSPGQYNRMCQKHYVCALGVQRAQWLVDPVKLPDKGLPHTLNILCFEWQQNTLLFRRHAKVPRARATRRHRQRHRLSDPLCCTIDRKPEPVRIAHVHALPVTDRLALSVRGRKVAKAQWRPSRNCLSSFDWPLRV